MTRKQLESEMSNMLKAFEDGYRRAAELSVRSRPARNKPPILNDPFITGGETDRVSTNIQWRGTDVCMDFDCDCGAFCHFDGCFAYTVKCPHCLTVWEMPVNLFPRKACEETPEYWVEHAQIMERDQDIDKPDA